MAGIEDASSLERRSWAKVTEKKSMLVVVAIYNQVANLARTSNWAKLPFASKPWQMRTISRKKGKSYPGQKHSDQFRENANIQYDLRRENSIPFCLDMSARLAAFPFCEPIAVNKPAVCY